MSSEKSLFRVDSIESRNFVWPKSLAQCDLNIRQIVIQASPGIKFNMRLTNETRHQDWIFMTKILFVNFQNSVVKMSVCNSCLTAVKKNDRKSNFAIQTYFGISWQLQTLRFGPCTESFPSLKFSVQFPLFELFFSSGEIFWSNVYKKEKLCLLEDRKLDWVNLEKTSHWSVFMCHKLGLKALSCRKLNLQKLFRAFYFETWRNL